ncbi:MAG: PepSY-like domain-containing protein [Vicinamibacterales bacterium]
MVLALILAAASAVAAEQVPKTANSLPAAIATAFKAAYPKATIRGVSQEKYAGKDAYEVESVENGKARDLIYLVDGTVAVIEEEIAASDLPPAVAAAIKADYPTASITRYERAVERGTTSYEVQFKGAKVGSAEYFADGKRK